MSRDRERLLKRVRRSGVSPRVVEAFEAVDRADFVPAGTERHAYSDRPVPLPRAQTTSQPTLIGIMVDAADIGAGDHVLEVGTGFGFQTAVLAHLARSVVSVERHDELAHAARANLERAGTANVEVVVGDGWQGHPRRAPYDSIVVSAAASELPPALGDQLSEGGRLVIPLKGPAGDDVYLYVKKGGALQRERLITPARFVPLVRDGQS